MQRFACLAWLVVLVSLPTKAFLQEEPVARLMSPLQDRIVPGSDVSGRLLVGLLGSGVGENPTSRTSGTEGYLAVYAPDAPKTNLICVNVVSADGQYRSGDVQYELPARASAEYGRFRLPYETVSKHPGFLAERNPAEMAVLARLGACADPAPHVLVASWRQPFIQSERLRVSAAVISGGRDTFVSWQLPTGEWSAPARECRSVAGTTVAFDKVCDVEAGSASVRRLRIQSFSPLGSPLPETFVDITLLR
jgi:hypothetical protein